MSIDLEELEEIEKRAKAAKTGYGSYMIESAKDVPALIAALREESEALTAVEHEVALVYDHITRGRISKATTLAFGVIAVADEIERENIDEELREAQRERDEALAQVAALARQLVAARELLEEEI